MSWTTVPSAAVGALIKAAKWNVVVTAVGELQTAVTGLLTETTKPVYETTRTGLTQSNSASTQAYSGSWSTSGLYLSSGSGIAVPKDGSYLVTQQVTKTAGSWNTRAAVLIKVGSTIKGWSSIDTGVSETIASVTTFLPSLTAGDLIVPSFLQNSGSNCTVDATLRIMFLGNT